jgi:acyl carrier protein
MEDTLRKIVAKIAETTPDFAKDVNLRDGLDVDSVRAVEIVFEIEHQFGIKLPEGRYAEVRSFSDLLALVTSLKAPTANAG